MIARTLILLSFLAFSQVGGAQEKYIKKFTPLADSLSRIYGIPTSVMLGIAIMESASGTSRNCKLLNNHFGVVGKNDLLRTKGLRSRYRQYPDALASYVHFCRIMTKKKFYKRLKGNNDYRLWVDAISKAGYSEIPDLWKERLLIIIRKHKLAS